MKKPASQKQQTEGAERPNIVLILADDMGFSDLGCYGGEISTPHLDRLAANGLRFSHCYNNAVCMPTRASLLTGLYPQQVGAGDRGRLQETGNVTIAEILRSAGYCTLMSGKWHNGNTPGELPVARGFDRYYGLLSGSSNYFNPGLKREGEPEPAHKSLGNMRPWGKDGEILYPYTPEDLHFYATDAFTKQALAFLEQYGHEEQPFFLYLAYTSPHFPMQAWPEDIAKYRGRYLVGWEVLREQRYRRLLDIGILEKPWKLSARDPLSPPWDTVTDKESWDLKMAVYAAMIERMDHGIGRVLEKIRALGKEANTVVIFLSDNGGCGEHIDRTPEVGPGPVNSYSTVDAPWANVSNAPFRRFKVFHYEGGVATPLIIAWPRLITQGGGICHEVSHVMDFMPTLLDLSHSFYPPENHGHPVLPMEGRSLLPALRGESLREREPLCWEFQGCRALRHGQWKIVTQGPPRNHVNIKIEPGHEPWELYDLDADRCETNNLASKYPEIVKELEAKWQAWERCCPVEVKGED